MNIMVSLRTVWKRILCLVKLEDYDTFFFDLKILVSILQAHIRGTLRTSQTSYKQKNKK